MKLGFGCGMPRVVLMNIKPGDMDRGNNKWDRLPACHGERDRLEDDPTLAPPTLISSAILSKCILLDCCCRLVPSPTLSSPLHGK